jgi:hypothetical protein
MWLSHQGPLYIFGKKDTGGYASLSKKKKKTTLVAVTATLFAENLKKTVFPQNYSIKFWLQKAFLPDLCLQNYW